MQFFVSKIIFRCHGKSKPKCCRNIALLTYIENVYENYSEKICLVYDLVLNHIKVQANYICKSCVKI